MHASGLRMLRIASSPWYNRNGWLGVNTKLLTELLTTYLINRLICKLPVGCFTEWIRIWIARDDRQWNRLLEITIMPLWCYFLLSLFHDCKPFGHKLFFIATVGKCCFLMKEKKKKNSLYGQDFWAYEYSYYYRTYRLSKDSTRVLPSSYQSSYCTHKNCGVSSEAAIEAV